MRQRHLEKRERDTADTQCGQTGRNIDAQIVQNDKQNDNPEHNLDDAAEEKQDRREAEKASVRNQFLLRGFGENIDQPPDEQRQRRPSDDHIEL